MAFDPLTSLGAVTTTLGIPDASEDALLQQLITEVSSLVCERLGRDVVLASNPLNPATIYASGQGRRLLVLKERPIQVPTYTGNTTAGSPTVTNLSGASFLWVGQPVTGPTLPVPGGQDLPGIANVTIAAISGSTLTLSANATANATAAPLTFGPLVIEDDAGYAGAPTNSFSSNNILTWGGDYTVHRRRADGSCRTGMLLRINDVWQTQYTRAGDMLSTMTSSGYDNVQVKAVWGFASTPADLEMATIRVISRIRKSAIYGQILASEHYEEFGYNLTPLQGPLNMGLLAGDVAPIIARYANSGMLA